MPDSSTRFSVVVVNFNCGQYLQGALASLAAQTVHDFEVILVDNASTDGSVDDLGETLPERLILRPQRENLGFAAANNLAAKEAAGEWLVLLNPDAQAAPAWLENLAQGTARHPAARFFASTQIDLHHPTCLDGAGDVYSGFGIPWRGGHGRSIHELPGEGTCFSPCGAGAMYHRQTFLDHGGFDERFFCFCEDIDLGYRMRLAGEHCVFLPDAVIHHAGGSSAAPQGEFALFHGARNRLWTFVKNTPLPLFIATLPLHFALTVTILIRDWFGGRSAGTLRGLCAGVKGLGPFWRARKALAERKVSLATLAVAMSWNPLTMLNRKAHVRRYD